MGSLEHPLLNILINLNILPFHIFREFVIRFNVNCKFMLTIDIKVFVVDKARIKVTILTNCVIFAVYAFKAGADNWLLKTEFTAIVIMSTKPISKFDHLQDIN
jgi:hypothetical protein